MPDWVERYSGIIKVIGGAIGGVLAIGAGWSAIGGPVPASRGWVDLRIEQIHEREHLAELIFALDKALVELGPGDARDALLAQRAALQAQIDD